jgi:site-specific recombinase XerD
MTQTSAIFQEHLALFLRSLAGNNLSELTQTAYRTDILQFFSWIAESDITVQKPEQVMRAHITDFLSFQADLGRSGVTRARKLASLREYFSYLVDQGIISVSPAQTVKMPKKEKRQKTYLRADEYSKLLAAAGGNPRDFAILQVFLQTGIRVSELIAIRLSDLDLESKTLKVHGKGKKERCIPLEKKGIQAIRSWLAVRQTTTDTHLFLNYEGSGLSIRGVRKIVDKYLKYAGIQKKISCHGLRHTFGTNKAAL